MIRSVKDTTAQNIFDGLNSKAARKLPQELHRKAKRQLDLLNAVTRVEDLKVPPGNQLEALKGTLKGFHSIRIDDQWRIIFRWLDGNAEDVKIIDYH